MSRKSNVSLRYGLLSGQLYVSAEMQNPPLPSLSSSAMQRPGDGGRGLGHQPGDLLRHPDGSGLQRPRHGWKPAGRDGHRGGGRHQPGAHLQGVSNPQAEPHAKDTNETRNHHLLDWYDLFIGGNCYSKCLQQIACTSWT